jgi:TPR repeat protein
MYENGQGVPKDDAVAFQWYREAAERNSAYGQLNLSRMYLDGRGVEKNRYEADTWMSKAAEQGLASAQFNLAVLYEMGVSGPTNLKEAIRWYTLAAEQGFVRAQFNLGLIYQNGCCSPTFLSYGLTDEERDEERNEYLKKAAYFYGLAAKQKHTRAQHNLAVMYQNGWGVAQDLVMAKHWHEEAKAQGYDPVLSWLARESEELK